MLIEGLLATERSITLVALIYRIVSWGAQVLVKSLLTAKRPVAFVAHWSMSWRIQVLLSTAKRPIALVAVNRSVSWERGPRLKM